MLYDQIPAGIIVNGLAGQSPVSLETESGRAVVTDGKSDPLPEDEKNCS